MLGKILVGAGVWLASNPTGRKVAKKSFRIMSKIGDRAVRKLPEEISSTFIGIEKSLKDFTNEEEQEERG